MTKPFVFNLNSEFIPLEIFHKISVSEKYSFFLDSVEKSRNADCSIIGYNADTVIKSKDNIIEIYEYGKIRRATGNPIKILENIFNKKAKIYNKYNCFSGAIGYFSYDIKQFFEKLPSTVIDDLKLPDLYFAFCKNSGNLLHSERSCLIPSNSFSPKIVMVPCLLIFKNLVKDINNYVN